VSPPSLTEEHLVIMKAVNIFLLYGINPDKCCFEFFKNPVKKNLISSYNYTDHRCAIRAVILKTRKGRDICVNPNQLWVKNLIDFLDMKSF
uniref:Eotaxin-like n=1 Tax=Poecilia latipinna TaxID=48699 RepID=A0A3B3TQP9_9TELE